MASRISQDRGKFRRVNAAEARILAARATGVNVTYTRLNGCLNAPLVADLSVQPNTVYSHMRETETCPGNAVAKVEFPPDRGPDSVPPEVYRRPKERRGLFNG